MPLWLVVVRGLGEKPRMPLINLPTMSPASSRQRLSLPTSSAATTLRANKVKNMTDARYRNALGGLDHLTKYKLMHRALNSLVLSAHIADLNFKPKTLSAARS